MINPNLQRLAAETKTMGVIEEPEAVGRVGVPGEGPFMTMYLRSDGEHIQEARFETYGCPTAVACGSWVTQWVVGKPVEQAKALSAHDLTLVLGGLPLGKEHCAGLAVGSLHDALGHLEPGRPGESGEVRNVSG